MLAAVVGDSEGCTRAGWLGAVEWAIRDVWEYASLEGWEDLGCVQGCNERELKTEGHAVLSSARIFNLAKTSVATTSRRTRKRQR